MVLLIACAACNAVPEASPRPTVSTPQAALSPEPTARPTVTTPEATVVPVPTPTAALDITVRELVLGEASDILAEMTVNRFEMPRDEFNRLNPNCRLLTPEGSLIQSSFALTGKKDQQFYASGNLNLPQYPADRVYSQPYFIQKDSVFVMRWEDASGHRFYHCPLREDQIGRPLAVYQRNNELFEAFVGADGRIEAKSERPFWQAVPSEAKNIALVKFDRAVYLTFWRADGQQIESARIRVNSLPAIPTPEPTETVLTADVEVFSYDFDGKKVVIVNQARLNEAKDHVFRKMFGQTTGWVNALLPRHLPDQNNWHNIPVRLDLSKGMKVIFYNIYKLSPQETVKYHEGIGIIHVVTSRYDVDETDRLVIEMFVTPGSARAAPIYLSYALTRLRDLKIDSDSDLVLFEILVGSPRPENDGLVDLSKFNLQLR